MKIAGREIGSHMPPYIVAEVGANHCGSLKTALKLIEAAKGAGADAVKFQCYTPDTITLDCGKPDFIIKDGPWKGRKLYELYEKAHTPFEWFPRLFDHAREVGITLFSSVFDKSSVDHLERLGCPAYKIASMEIVDLPLIRYATQTGKPLIISTGMAHYGEIHDAYRVVEKAGLATQTAFLNCVSGYPTEPEEVDLERLWIWKGQEYYPPECLLGLSDHTQGRDIAIASVANGDCIIEKHLTLPVGMHPNGPNPPEDWQFSMRPWEFASMARATRMIWSGMSERKTPKSEDSSRQLRRSLYAVADIKAGERFTDKNVRSIRPAYGLPPDEIGMVLGASATCDIECGTALKHEMITQSERWEKVVNVQD